MVYTLDTIRKAAFADTKLPVEIVEFIKTKLHENGLGGDYTGHTVHDFSTVSIYLGEPKSCATKAKQSIRVDKEWQDRSVIAAFLDLDEDGIPLCLDII
jgi:hypothetical protein